MISSATESGEFWSSALFFGPANHILHEMHEIPAWVVLLPLPDDGRRLPAVGLYVSRSSPQTPVRLAERCQPLYRFLLNKWYFDELYDFLFVRPAFWLGRLFWKGGDGQIIDGFGPDGVSARVLDVHGSVVRLQTRLHLPLRLRDADRRRGAHHLLPGQRSALMSVLAFSPASPSCLWSAPLSSCWFAGGDSPAAKNNARWIAAVDDPDRVRPVALRLGAVHLRRRPASSSSSRRTGSAPASPTRWASTASPCPSCC